MSVAACFASISGGLFVLLFGLFLWITLPRRCPRCGSRDWVPAPHIGRYWAYCRKCAQFLNLAEGETK